jgi:hypothetical protein
MKKYFYSNGQEQVGPLTLEELKQQDIQPKTLIWFEGLEEWTPAGELVEMRHILELKPPPILREEKNESIEQMRAIEMGMNILGVKIKQNYPSVNTIVEALQVETILVKDILQKELLKSINAK